MDDLKYVIGDVGYSSFQLISKGDDQLYTTELIIDYRKTVGGYNCVSTCFENCYDVDGELYSWCEKLTPDWVDDILPQVLSKRGF